MSRVITMPLKDNDCYTKRFFGTTIINVSDKIKNIALDWLNIMYNLAKASKNKSKKKE